MRHWKQRIAGVLAIMFATVTVIPSTYLGNVPLTKAATYNVTNTADSGAGSFRQALLDANQNAGLDTINFSATGAIATSSNLPQITDGVIIDATTTSDVQAGPDVVINCSGESYCLQFNGGSSHVVKGLALTGASFAGIDIGSATNGLTIGGTGARDAMEVNGNSDSGIYNNGGDNIVIYNTIIGNINANGTGIKLLNNANNITIGGSALNQGNIISNNTGVGIDISASSNVTIRGNKIGTDGAGNTDRGNGTDGILVGTGVTSLTIGGAQGSNEGNVISGNGNDGIELNGSGSVIIKGNYIGIGQDGSTILNNAQNGIRVLTASNTIGGVDGDRNHISGNSQAGILITGAAASSNTISYNRIGVSTTGAQAKANGNHGISIATNAANNTITNNLISGNTGSGVNIASDAGDGTVFYANTIGLGLDGSTVIANTNHGINSFRKITVGQANDNTKINVIAGNSFNGIHIGNATASGTVIENNIIGMDKLISVTKSNQTNGILIDSSAVNITVGNNTGGTQVIGFKNGQSAIKLDGNGTTNIKIGKHQFIRDANTATSAIIDLVNGANGGLLPANDVTVATSNSSEVSGTTTQSGGTVTIYKTTVGPAIITDNFLADVVATGTNWAHYAAVGAGTGTVLVSTTDGRSSGTKTYFAITADVTAPTTPVVTSSTGTVASSAYSLTGTKDANTSMAINGVTVVALGAETSFSIPKTLTEGLNSFNLTSTDYSNNSSATGSYSVTLDTTAPTAPVLSYSAVATSNPATVTGTAEANAKIYVDGVYTTTARSDDGSFALSLGLTSGVSNVFVITAKDAVDNTSPSVTVSISTGSAGASGGGSGGSSSNSGSDSDSDSGETSEDDDESMAGEEETNDTTEDEVTEEPEEETPTDETEEDSSSDETEEDTSSDETDKEETPVKETTVKTDNGEITPIKEAEDTRDSLPETSVEASLVTEISDSGVYGKISEDGVANWWKEEFFGSKDLIDLTRDSDGDGLYDVEEFAFASDPNSADSDDDGLSDAEEVLIFGGNPSSWDSDGDRIPDNEEAEGQALVYNATSEVNNRTQETYIEENDITLESGETLGTIDTDSDGISDYQELAMGIDPTVADTDSDGLSDGEEVLNYDTNPSKSSKPHAIRISNVKVGQNSASGAQFVSGSGEAEHRVEIYTVINGKEELIAKTETDSTGKFAVLTDELPAGTYTLTAVLKDGGKIKSISYPIELKVVESTIEAPKLDALSTDEFASMPKISGLAVSENTTIVATWQSLVLSNTIVTDISSQSFEMTPPSDLEEGDHKVTVYAVDNETNEKSKPVRLEFTVTTTGFITGQSEGTPWLKVGGAAALLLALIGLAVVVRKRQA